MTTTFTGPQHGPWGFYLLHDTYVSIGYGGSTDGMIQTYPGSGVYFRAWDNTPPADYTPTTAWTQPVGWMKLEDGWPREAYKTVKDRPEAKLVADELRRLSTCGPIKPVPAQRPGVTPAPFPKPALDRIGPYIVSDVREAVRACAGSVYETNASSDFKLVCDVLRKLCGEGK